MRALRSLLALLVLLLPAAGFAQDNVPWYAPQGEERILSFLSDVTIKTDGDLDVTETIQILALNQQINHGIQRDFPTTYENGAGLRTNVGFTVVSVQRDGHEEPWERISLSNGVRIRIGSADTTVEPGKHSYVIRYRTTRQLIYGENQDELYWNATGTGWTFPIDLAEARITLPESANFGDRAVYTGPQGSTEGNAEVIEERPGFIAFRTTRPLGREEGLTVAAAFPKGVVEAPSTARRAFWWLQDWGALAAALLACIGLLVYYIRAWWIAGRGPRAGTIVPVFTPPDGLSPAAVRYIANMKFDNRAFSAAMVDLGVRGKLHIAQEDGGLFSKGTTTLSRTELSPSGGETSLPAPEVAMHEKLFAKGDAIELKQENHATLQAARSALQQGLSSAYEGTMFRKNSSWAGYGLVLIGLTMLAVAVVALLTATTIGLDRKLGLPLLAIVLLAIAWGLRELAMKAKGCLSALLWVALAGACFGAAGSALATIVVGTRGGRIRGVRTASDPASRDQRFLVDVCPHARRSADDGPHCGFPPISVHYGGKSARNPASSRKDPGAVRTLPALRDRAGCRKPLGGTLRRCACCGSGSRHDDANRQLVFWTGKCLGQSGRLRQRSGIVLHQHRFLCIGIA